MSRCGQTKLSDMLDCESFLSAGMKTASVDCKHPLVNPKQLEASPAKQIDLPPHVLNEQGREEVSKSLCLTSCMQDSEGSGAT